MTPKPPPEDRKQQIRDAALRCFARNGVARTRLSDIAKEAGLSKGGVYFHYHRKEDLFEELLLVRQETIKAWGQRWAHIDNSRPIETLRGLLLDQLTMIEVDNTTARFSVHLLAMRDGSTLVQETIDLHQSIVHERYTAILKAGVQQGVFLNVEPNALAQCVMAVVHGFATSTAITEQACLPTNPAFLADLVLNMVRATGHDPSPFARDNDLAPASLGAAKTPQSTAAVCAHPPVLWSCSSKR